MFNLMFYIFQEIFFVWYDGVLKKGFPQCHVSNPPPKNGGGPRCTKADKFCKPTMGGPRDKGTIVSYLDPSEYEAHAKALAREKAGFKFATPADNIGQPAVMPQICVNITNPATPYPSPASPNPTTGTTTPATTPASNTKYWIIGGAVALVGVGVIVAISKSK